MLKPACANFLNDNKFSEISFAATRSVNLRTSPVASTQSKRFLLPYITISANSFLFALFITPFSHLLKSLKVKLFLTMICYFRINNKITNLLRL